MAASAQQTGSNTSGGQIKSFKFEATTRLVVEDVSSGARTATVPDLKPGAFTVLEDGKPQKITVFEFQKLENQALAAPALTPAAARAGHRQVRGQQQITPEKPGDIKIRTAPDGHVL